VVAVAGLLPYWPVVAIFSASMGGESRLDLNQAIIVYFQVESFGVVVFTTCF